MTIPIPTSAHNEALAGDTLYSAFLNYEWRQIVVPYIVRGMEEIARTITDESDRQDFEIRYGAMIEDFYNEDVMDGSPVGMVAWFPIKAAEKPHKWLFCDGTVLDAADYPELYEVMHSNYAIGGVITLPNLQERFLYGVTSDSQVGNTGGAETHTLTVSEMPAHSHTVGSASGTGAQARAATGTNTSVGSFNSGSQGSGAAHNNMPPYTRGYWLIKALP